MATVQEILDSFIDEIKKRGRFSTIEGYVVTPSDSEITSAIYDTLDDINSFPPQTGYELSSIYENHDTRWKRLVIYGAVANVLSILVVDWVDKGIDADINDMSIQSKKSDYESLRDHYIEQFNDKLEKLKKSSQKFVKRGTYSTRVRSVSSRYNKINVSRIY